MIIFTRMFIDTITNIITMEKFIFIRMIMNIPILMNTCIFIRMIIMKVKRSIHIFMMENMGSIIMFIRKMNLSHMIININSFKNVSVSTVRY